MAQELITPEPKANSFEANGRVYFIEDKISLARFRWYERFRIQAGFGVDFKDLYQLIRRNIEYFERIAQGERVFTVAVNDNYNSLKGIVHVDTPGEWPHWVWLCTLFINRADEDRRNYDVELGRQKIEDWQEAGIESDFFYELGKILVSDYKNVYEQTSQLFSQNQTETPTSH